MKSNIIAEGGSAAPRELTFDSIPASVCHNHSDAGGNFDVLHWHSEVQLSVVTSGRVRFITRDCEYVLEKGQGIFLNSNRIHTARKDTEESDCSYLCIRFDPEELCGSLCDSFAVPLIAASAPDAIPLHGKRWTGEVCALMNELAEVYARADIGYELRMQIILLQIWLLIYENCRAEEDEAKYTSFSEKQRIETLCGFINNNYAEKISLSDIANSAHISNGECCRIFKRLLNMTPFQYLVHVRLAKSAEFLTDTDYSISQIAQHVGFCSSSYYTKCFRKEYGCVPLKYRQRSNRLSSPAAKS